MADQRSCRPCATPVRNETEFMYWKTEKVTETKRTILYVKRTEDGQLYAEEGPAPPDSGVFAVSTASGPEEVRTVFQKATRDSKTSDFQRWPDFVGSQLNKNSPISDPSWEWKVEMMGFPGSPEDALGETKWYFIQKSISGSGDENAQQSRFHSAFDDSIVLAVSSVNGMIIPLPLDQAGDLATTFILETV
ncbi:uncharacterized protein LOC135812189 [Sycon ciliatum]|uniref:uncharacterized protein LOC135812189 n=1 Tax=Sycon ciliatum TaxID=27933 RepID=UPI0031F62F0C